MSRYILIRETGSPKVTVVDKLKGTAEEVDAPKLGLPLDREEGQPEQPAFAGIAMAMVVTAPPDYSSQYHYRA